MQERDPREVRAALAVEYQLRYLVAAAILSIP